MDKPQAEERKKEETQEIETEEEREMGKQIAVWCTVLISLAGF